MKNKTTLLLGALASSFALTSPLSLASDEFCQNSPDDICTLAKKYCNQERVKANGKKTKITLTGEETLSNGLPAKYTVKANGYIDPKKVVVDSYGEKYRFNCNDVNSVTIADTIKPELVVVNGGAGYTFALPGNQAYNVLPGNLYLPAQNSGYTVTYQKSDEPTDNLSGQGISAPRPGGYAFTLPANQKIVINPGNLQLPGNAEGYSIIYANSSDDGK
ncbi:hypothetical protein EDC56_1080 [Sinobacterium caligoides]|uniref:Uncharacterized protein n=1 Tax=Sinobacterium caligoides TaxID=933926 RepID=A0A3N2E1V3_9GAMM|nr:hypothetical protein [Sinobacterium caligoides]ROS05545.1 hypothetical protein EDC56_1080 [Sinobacterium caligoides]